MGIHGPNNNVGGRTRSILIDPTNLARMYAGSVSGGVFITDNGGPQLVSFSWNRDHGEYQYQ